MTVADMAALAASQVERQTAGDPLALLQVQVDNNNASMDVFFILVSGYLVFLMQTVRATMGDRLRGGRKGHVEVVDLVYARCVCECELLW